MKELRPPVVPFISSSSLRVLLRTLLFNKKAGSPEIPEVSFIIFLTSPSAFIQAHPFLLPSL